MVWRFLPVFLLCFLLRASGTDPVEPMVNQTGTLPVAGTRNVAMKFAIITYTLPSEATATATVTNGFLTSIAVTGGGQGYTTPPVVTISGGGGTGAKALAVVSNGSVVSINVRSAGMHFTSTPVVSIPPPPVKTVVDTLWSNDETSVAGSEPASAVTLQVSGGAFSAMLGYTGIAHMAALPPEVLTHADARVRVWYRTAAAGPFKKLPVDAPLHQSSYASTASYADLAGAVLDGTITTNSFAGGVLNQIEAAPYSNLQFTNLTSQQVTIPGTATIAPLFTSQDTTGGYPGELGIVANGVNLNTLFLKNLSEDGWSALTARSATGGEHMAIGLGGATAGGDGFTAYHHNVYLELTDANNEGWSPDFVLNQQTTYGGTKPLASSVRMVISNKTGGIGLLPRNFFGTNIGSSDAISAAYFYVDPDQPIFTFGQGTGDLGYADIRGADAHHSIVLRSGGNGSTGNDYSCIAGTLAEGGGHRFYTQGRDAALSFQIARDRTQVKNIFNLQPSTRPANAQQGDCYSDQSDGHLYYFNGTNWKQLDN